MHSQQSGLWRQDLKKTVRKNWKNRFLWRLSAAPPWPFLVFDARLSSCHCCCLSISCVCVYGKLCARVSAKAKVDNAILTKLNMWSNQTLGDIMVQLSCCNIPTNKLMRRTEPISVLLNGSIKLRHGPNLRKHNQAIPSLRQRSLTLSLSLCVLLVAF